MNILLLYPEKNNNQKSIYTRLSSFLYKSNKENFNLIEISIHLPITWEEKVLDLNNDKLKYKDIAWADYVILYAEKNQSASTVKLVQRCKAQGKTVVLCGNAIASNDKEYAMIDHLVENPAGFEVFSNDVANNTIQKVYKPLLLRKNRLPFQAYSLWGLIGSFSKQIQPHSA